MRRIFLLLAAVVCSAELFAGQTGYIFAYAAEKNAGRNGLHFAWSMDGEAWNPIGPEFSFIKCDYSSWGSEKRMVDPFLFQDREGVWHCVWTLNDYDQAFAHAASDDLVHWRRQSYNLMNSGVCLTTAVSNDTAGGYFVSWTTPDGTAYHTSTGDFRNYTPAVKGSSPSPAAKREKAFIAGKYETGTIHEVPRGTIDDLVNRQKLAAYNASLNGETISQDAVRFASLKPVDAAISVDAAQSRRISDMLMGVFYEDINYAADGGLYAELVQNRNFEYSPEDTGGRNRNWDSRYSWSVRGGDFTIDTLAPIHPNSLHYAVLRSEKAGETALVNSGFNGIVLKKGDKYDFSIFARAVEGRGGLTVRLTGSNGEIYGESSTKPLSSKWEKYNAVITSSADAENAQLEVIPRFAGTAALDMISLFPQKTFKNRKNGLRADIAQAIADMKPRFVRFPGGCVAHGQGIDNMYLWQNTVGPLEARKPQRNIWNYHQSAGLGYFEYFQFCEDIGAQPVPIVAAGVPCQNSAHHHGYALGGQQGGIPMEDMDEYVQSVLDLVEWANGDRNSRWGRVRAEAGHPEPFGLKYIGVGNEDQITDVFEERFTMIYNALREKHPEITVIGTAGPFYEGTDYEEGWSIADKLEIPIMDEHYYNPPGWFINNQDYYDRYDRSRSKVYLGEYAAHVAGRHNNIETALAEAIYLTALERNGDIVEMASYAPLLAREGNTQWNPDLIYFTGGEVRPTVGYHVQKLFGVNAGDCYHPSRVSLSDESDPVRKRIGVSIVTDSATGDLIIKMVNILPVAVNATVDAEGFVTEGKKAEIATLTGDPSDRNAKPSASQRTLSGELRFELAPYSFTVVRIDGN